MISHRRAETGWKHLRNCKIRFIIMGSPVQSWVPLLIEDIENGALAGRMQVLFSWREGLFVVAVICGFDRIADGFMSIGDVSQSTPRPSPIITLIIDTQLISTTIKFFSRGFRHVSNPLESTAIFRKISYNTLINNML